MANAYIRPGNFGLGILHNISEIFLSKIRVYHSCTLSNRDFTRASSQMEIDFPTLVIPTRAPIALYFVARYISFKRPKL